MSKQKVKTIPITRMDCPTCVPLLEREVKRLEGVDEAQGNYVNKTLKVNYDPDRVRIEEVEAAIERVGYRIAYKKYPTVLSKLKRLLVGEGDYATPALTDVDFPEKVLHASKPVAVLFSSPTCPTCRFYKRQFKKLAEEVEDKADLYEMDITATEKWQDYDISSIPTVLTFRNGRIFERFDALPKTDEIKRALGFD